MIWLSYPLRLLALVAWVLILVVLARRQVTAVRWIRAHVAPRFQRTLTAYTRRGLVGHIVFLLATGALLVAAAAGPSTSGAVEREVETRSIILIIDASLSMGATDMPPAGAADTEGESVSRFVRATAFSRDLVEAMPDAAFGLLTFSGITVVHMPPTRDHRAVSGLLDTLTFHVDFTRSGTRYSTVFDAVIHMVQRTPGSYQVVLLSDGELPQPDEFAESLSILERLHVPIHTVGVGTLEGQGRVVYDLEDVIAGAEDREVITEYHTSRSDVTLERISESTGGSMVVLEGDTSAGDLVPRLLEIEPTVESIVAAGRLDLSVCLLGLFGLCFAVETLWLPRRGRVDSSAVVVLALCIIGAGCQSRTWMAHTHNEEGIIWYDSVVHDEAAASFERSISYRVRQHIPLVNLANTAAAEDDISTAHDLYEEAIVLQPDLAEAHNNDGHVLYRWGEIEIDPTGCALDRTRQLWEQALKRFQQAEALAGWSLGLAAGAAENAAALTQRFVELDLLAQECQPPPPAAGGSQGGESQSEGESGGGGEDDEGPESGGRESERPSGSGGDEPGQGSDASPPGTPPPGPRPLTDDERRQIDEALARIGQESAGATDFRHAGPQQLSPGKARQASGVRVWW